MGPDIRPHLSRQTVARGHCWRSTSVALARAPDVIDMRAKKTLTSRAERRGLTGGSFARNPSTDGGNKGITERTPKRGNLVRQIKCTTRSVCTSQATCSCKNVGAVLAGPVSRGFISAAITRVPTSGQFGCYSVRDFRPLVGRE